MDPVLGYFFIFFARVIDVSLGTVRMLMVFRGKKFIAAAIGFFEVSIFVMALGQVFRNLSQPLNLLAYALGFATGNIVGSYIEEKMAVGFLTVQVISLCQPLELAQFLRDCGFGVTVIEGQGREGTRYLLNIIVKRKELSLLQEKIDKWDPCSFVTIFDARTIKGGIFSNKRK